ncbi:hypothetical protein chiPu_0010152 [Chiloscyllium punctatum]|uniref:Uncharacterized protein n=1 Tax=Chiloscyllium punctatum TaxID=137246 RepID=A0A401SMU2_CHIPU|nr:hypothetical protein [Chiloscyllium punctatum]
MISFNVRSAQEQRQTVRERDCAEAAAVTCPHSLFHSTALVSMSVQLQVHILEVYRATLWEQHEHNCNCP